MHFLIHIGSIVISVFVYHLEHNNIPTVLLYEVLIVVYLLHYHKNWEKAHFHHPMTRTMLLLCRFLLAYKSTKISPQLTILLLQVCVLSISKVGQRRGRAGWREVASLLDLQLR